MKLLTEMNFVVSRISEVEMKIAASFVVPRSRSHFQETSIICENCLSVDFHAAYLSFGENLFLSKIIKSIVTEPHRTKSNR